MKVLNSFHKEIAWAKYYTVCPSAFSSNREQTTDVPNISVDSTSNSGSSSANEPTSCDQSNLVITNPTDRIKCEYCKMKGCSDTCTNRTASGNTALVHSEDAVNTDIASEQRCDSSVQTANSSRRSVLHMLSSFWRTGPCWVQICL